MQKATVQTVYNLKRTDTILAVEIGENKVQLSRFWID